MSLVEICLALLILTAATAAGSAGLAAMVRPARLSAAAADLAADIRVSATKAALSGRPAAIEFKPNSYEISGPGQSIKSYSLPRRVLIIEAKFGSAGKSAPRLTLGANGVSSPGRVILAGQDGQGSCLITRSLRGLTTCRCSYGS